MKLNLPREATFKGPAIVWKRIAAFIIDLFILDFVIGFPFRSLLTKIVPSGDFSVSYDYLLSNPQITTALTLIMFLYGFLALLYFSILEYTTRQTIGKIFMNIMVEPTNKEIGYFNYVVRSMYLLTVFPFILLWIADPLFMFFSKDKRRLSEILSKTRTTAVYFLR
jgi:hypothetical protein